MPVSSPGSRITPSPGMSPPANPGCQSRVARPMLIEEFLPKVEEWIERSNGKLRADVAHDKLVALGFTGSERTTRRAVAVVKKRYCLGRVSVCYDPLPGQNFTGGSRLSLVGSGA